MESSWEQVNEKCTVKGSPQQVKNYKNATRKGKLNPESTSFSFFFNFNWFEKNRILIFKSNLKDMKHGCWDPWHTVFQYLCRILLSCLNISEFWHLILELRNLFGWFVKSHWFIKVLVDFCYYWKVFFFFMEGGWWLCCLLEIRNSEYQHNVIKKSVYEKDCKKLFCVSRLQDSRQPPQNPHISSMASYLLMPPDCLHLYSGPSNN